MRSGCSGRIGLFADEMAKYAVLRRRQVTHDTAIVRVSTRMEEPAWGEQFTPNAKFPQCFCVLVQTSDAQAAAIRPYTPIDVGPESLDFLVKGYPAGAVSRSLFAKQPGESVWMQGPRVKFDFDRQLGRPQRLVAVAGGTGIAPIYQVLKAGSVAGLPKLLIFANKTDADKLLLSELAEIEQLTVRHVLQDRDGFVSAEHLATCNENDLIFLCGPQAFTEHVQALLPPRKLRVIKF